MQLYINGKSMAEWSVSELQVLVNESYMYKEDEHIDYKINFSFLECKDKSEIKRKKIEFCNDVCAFANSDSGYLFFGISEEKGEPKDLIGVEIENGDTDKFELDRRNELSWIQPLMPLVSFKFIWLKENKYVVVVFIEKGSYSPYVCRKNDESYYFYKRSGNQKRLLNYKEVEQMFKYSNSLSKSIKDFVEDRIEILRNYNLQNLHIETKGIVTLHIIPDDFQSNNEISKMFYKEKNEKTNFSRIFEGFCLDRSIPFVDGLIYNNISYNNGLKVRIYNNGIVELSIDVDKYVISTDKVYKEEKLLLVNEITEKFTDMSRQYIENKDIFTNSKRLYLCASIVDADGLISEKDMFDIFINHISDVYNLCPPIEISDADNEIIVDEAIENLITVVCLACGIKNIDKYLDK